MEEIRLLTASKEGGVIVDIRYLGTVSEELVLCVQIGATISVMEYCMFFILSILSNTASCYDVGIACC